MILVRKFKIQSISLIYFGEGQRELRETLVGHDDVKVTSFVGIGSWHKVTSKQKRRYNVEMLTTSLFRELQLNSGCQNNVSFVTWSTATKHMTSF